jgi:PAS domain S-box-containing protein
MRRVFIVEDNRFISAIFTMFLRDLGHDLVGYTSCGHEAVDQCNKLKPDVILMDIHLEGDLDGVQVAEVLHREVDIPVIYVSIDTTSRVIERAILSNSYGYLVKPITKKELGISIDLAYNKHRLDVEQKRREQNYREFISESPLPVIVIRNGKVTYLNNQGLEVFKTHYIEDVIGLDFSDFVHPEYKEQFLRAIDFSSVHEKRIVPFQSKIKTLHGSYYYAEITGSKVWFNDQLSIQLILTDISIEKTPSSLNQR